MVEYALTTVSTTPERDKLPSHLSAEAAEVFALTRACILATGQSGASYTDSRYAFGVVHDLGTLWKQHDFLTSSGQTISHSKRVDNLLKGYFCSLLKVSVCKCLAHANSSDPVSNAMADLAAKASGCLRGEPPVLQMVSLPDHNLFSLTDISDLQSPVGPVELRKWKRLCTYDQVQKLCLGPAGLPVSPRSRFPYLAKLTHGEGSCVKGGSWKLLIF